MFQTNFQSVLTMLVNHELPRTQPIFSNGEIIRDGIYISICLAADDYEQNKHLKRYFHILFCGNVSVFHAETGQNEERLEMNPCQIPIENWINSSNHDSCWNTDGFSFINTVYFEMCKAINPKIAPKFVDTRASFVSFSCPVKKCKITYKRKNDDSYRNEIVKVVTI